MGELRKVGLVGEMLAEGSKCDRIVRGISAKEYRELIEQKGFLFVRKYSREWGKVLPDQAVEIDDNVIAIVNPPKKIAFHVYGNETLHERDIRLIYLEKDEEGVVWVKVYLR